jgi:hypothetical protein
MIGGVGLFLLDSSHLSREALIFPGILIVALIGTLVWALAGQFSASRVAVVPVAEDDDETGPILVGRPWLIVLLPVVLTAAFDLLGVLVALLTLVIGGQAIFGIKSWTRSVLIAVAVVAPTYFVFKYILYARFPGGVFGF